MSETKGISGAEQVASAHGGTRSRDEALRATVIHEEDRGQLLANDECFCATPTVASNEYDETWCAVCGERLIFEVPSSVTDVPR